MNSATKLKQLNALAKMRMAEKYKKYYNVGDFLNGAYESESFVSPYSKSACNVDSDIMIIAQDWSSFEHLNSSAVDDELATKGYSSNWPTNLNLFKLLDQNFNLKFNDIFATNLFVFIKGGGVSERIARSDLIYCAKKYTLKEVEIVSPKLVICLGAEVYNVLSIVLSGKVASASDSIDNPIFFNNSLIVGSYHTGARGTSMAGGFSNLNKHWSKISKLYSTLN